MRSVLRHVSGLWGAYWPVPGSIFGVYAVIMYSIGDLRPEHVVFAVVIAAMAYAGPGTKSFLIDISPYPLTLLGYDIVRYFRQALVTPDRVLACELADLDRLLFPVGGGKSIQDWLVIHSSTALDLLFAVPYAVFAYVVLLYAGYLYFVDRPRMRRFLWAFAAANYVTYVLWLAFPAAPPWYVRAHGCAIDLSVAPSPAALTRVDALLPVPYFQMFYGRAASVFGAMPSMHNAYPLLGLFTAWRHITWRTKPFHIAYFLLMFIASLYLDHHWVIDAIAGWILAGIAVLAASRLARLVEARTAEPAPAPVLVD